MASWGVTGWVRIALKACERATRAVEYGSPTAAKSALQEATHALRNALTILLDEPVPGGHVEDQPVTVPPAQPERRSGNGSPPTVLMLAYQNMDPILKRLMQRVGIVLILFSVGMPMLIEPFVELSWIYWAFALAVTVLGVCLLYMPLGIWFGNTLGGLAVKLRPGLKGKFHSDRRGPRDEEQGD